MTRFVKILVALLTLSSVLLIGLFSAYRREVSRGVGSGLELVSFAILPRGVSLRPNLRAVFVPSGEFRSGRSRIWFDRIAVEGDFWPPLKDCSAKVSGFSMKVSTLRPAAALEPMFEMDRMTHAGCGTVIVDSGEIVLGAAAFGAVPLHLEVARAVWTRGNNEVEVRCNRLDGQATNLVVRAVQKDVVETRGEWNLSGLDITQLLARLGMAWSSRTDVGLLEFESRGDSLKETGKVRISSWVLIGNDEVRPFRLSVPGVAAEFSAGDTEMLFGRVVIDRPSYDLVGAEPDLFKNLMSAVSGKFWRPKKFKSPKVDVPERRRSRPDMSHLPASFAVRVDHLRIDTGQAYAIDRPERTKFAARVSDLSVNVEGSASVLARSPNTDIRFLLNGRKEMRWKAITDFSTWPPQFRLTDVR